MAADPRMLQLLSYYREAELRKGRIVPGIDARSCAHEIEKVYGFPHYE